MSLAPIMVTTYRRLDHVKKTIAALQANSIARDSRLFITSDGPLPEHEEEVMAVRDFLESVGGFRSVKVLPRAVNSRRENWTVRRGLLEEHGRLICVEEDCVTSPWFLTFMNRCLDRFRDREDYFSVSGYLPPVKALQSPDFRLLELGRFNAWGFGIWKRSDDFVRERMSIEEYEAALNCRKFRRLVERQTGLNIFGMWKRVAEGRLFAYDVMANYEILRRGMSVLYPGRSLVNNIGFDGSGEHCGTSDRFQVTVHGEELPDLDRLEVSRSAVLRGHLADFNGGGWMAKAKFNAKRLRGRMKASPLASDGQG